MKIREGNVLDNRPGSKARYLCIASIAAPCLDGAIGDTDEKLGMGD